MDIILKQADIEKAVRHYVESQGISLRSKTMAITFNMGRGDNGLSASLKIEDIDLPAFTETNGDELTRAVDHLSGLASSTDRILPGGGEVKAVATEVAVAADTQLVQAATTVAETAATTLAAVTEVSTTAAPAPVTTAAAAIAEAQASADAAKVAEADPAPAAAPAVVEGAAEAVAAPAAKQTTSLFG
jgi:hypothetical protein